MRPTSCTVRTTLMVIFVSAACVDDGISDFVDEQETLDDAALEAIRAERLARVRAAQAEIDFLSPEEVRNRVWEKRWPEIWGPRGFDYGNAAAPPTPFSDEDEGQAREYAFDDEFIEELRAVTDQRWLSYLETVEERYDRQQRGVPWRAAARQREEEAERRYQAGFNTAVNRFRTRLQGKQVR